MSTDFRDTLYSEIDSFFNFQKEVIEDLLDESKQTRVIAKKYNVTSDFVIKQRIHFRVWMKHFLNHRGFHHVSDFVDV